MLEFTRLAQLRIKFGSNLIEKLVQTGLIARRPAHALLMRIHGHCRDPAFQQNLTQRRRIGLQKVFRRLNRKVRQKLQMLDGWTGGSVVGCLNLMKQLWS